MTRRPAAIIGVAAALFVLSATAPFLPGPTFLHAPAKLFYVLNQIAALLVPVVILPLAFLWIAFALWRWLRAARGEFDRRPLHLVLVILLLPLSQFLSEPARAKARNRAFRRAEPLIEAIEAFRRDFDRYPESLRDLASRLPDGLPTPGSIGSPVFAYEASPDTYDLEFTQCTVLCFNFNVVIYNPLDAHVAAGDLPRLYETGFPHWRYYVFD